MKVQAPKETLLKGIQTVQNIITTKSTLPILSNILIETQKECMRLVATDLDIGIACSIPVKVIEEGAATVPAKKFSDIIKELPDSEATINAKKNNIVTIECQKCFFKVIGLPKDEFPKLPEFHNKELLSLKQTLLKNMLSLTAFAMSRDETRYVLNGIYFVFKPEGVSLVATDGRRLALAEKKTAIPGGFERRMIVPTKTILELSRALKEEGDVKIVFGENQVLFDLGDVQVISRLIEGEFPNYEQVIPREAKDKVKVDRERFLSATRRVSLLTNQNSQAIKIDLFKNKMVISKTSPEIGEAKEEIDVDYKGGELSIGFNPHYIIDVLKSLDKKEEISLELVSPDKPGAIRTEDKYTYIVLPMQLT